MDNNRTMHSDFDKNHLKLCNTVGAVPPDTIPNTLSNQFHAGAANVQMWYKLSGFPWDLQRFLQKKETRAPLELLPPLLSLKPPIAFFFNFFGLLFFPLSLSLLLLHRIS